MRKNKPPTYWGLLSPSAEVFKPSMGWCIDVLKADLGYKHGLNLFNDGLSRIVYVELYVFLLITFNTMDPFTPLCYAHATESVNTSLVQVRHGKNAGGTADQTLCSESLRSRGVWGQPVWPQRCAHRHTVPLKPHHLSEFLQKSMMHSDQELLLLSRHMSRPTGS